MMLDLVGKKNQRDLAEWSRRAVVVKAMALGTKQEGEEEECMQQQSSVRS
jgi:hypothetical protein